MSAGEDEFRSPVDRAALVRIRDRVRTQRQVDRVSLTLRRGVPCLIIEYDLTWYPDPLKEAYLDVRWYVNDDFEIHYHESWPNDEWNQRWDRHPNPHNTRDHVHPPPDATTPGEDSVHPDGLHEVMRTVEQSINERIRSLWDEPSR